MNQHEIRAAAIAYVAELSKLGTETVRWSDIFNWEFQGERVPLVSQQGIFKPKVLNLPISIRTTPPKLGQEAPYNDHFTPDGRFIYSYRGADPSHRDNVLLRSCMEEGVQLLHFEGVTSGVYSASQAAIVGDDPSALQFDVALFDLDVAMLHSGGGSPEMSQRRYQTVQVRRRQHQAGFRHRVLEAYGTRCALCHLRHRQLLDAAHIRSDADGGEPVVTNGISMCKIHHAAFDGNIVGIRPDLVVDVRTDILAEIDGPMLRHGIQDLHGQGLIVPRREHQKPSEEAIAERYELFREAS